MELLNNFAAVIYTLDEPNFGGDESSVVKNATVGIQDTQNAFLSVYPNPATNYVVLQTGSLNGLYEVTDISGKKICSGQIETVKTTVPTLGWASGTYLVKVAGTSLTPIIKRFTIK